MVDSLTRKILWASLITAIVVWAGAVIIKMAVEDARAVSASATAYKRVSGDIMRLRNYHANEDFYVQ